MLNFLYCLDENYNKQCLNSIYSILNYSDIEWTDSVHTKPTEEEINAKILEMKLAQPMQLLRVERNKLLSATDWTQTPDVPESIRTKWASYRQALRDLPANTSDPKNPIWPTKPN